MKFYGVVNHVNKLCTYVKAQIAFLKPKSVLLFALKKSKEWK